MTGIPTPEPPEVSPVGLRERIAAAVHDEICTDDAPTGDCEAVALAVLPVVEQAHGDLVVRAANLRAERDEAQCEVERLETLVLEKHELIQGWARYGERVKADRARFGDMLIAALGLQDERVGRHFHHLVPEACKEIARLRAELASRSTPALPDGAAEQVAKRMLRIKLYGVALNGRYDDLARRQWDKHLTDDERADWLADARALLADLGLSSPATDPEPATPDREVRALLVHPAAWNGLVTWLTSRGLTVDSAGDLEGIPTYSMGISDELAAVAPQAPAEPTSGLRIADGGSLTFTEPNGVVHLAGPAVPEDTRPWTGHEVTTKRDRGYTSAHCSTCGVIAGDFDDEWVQDRADSHRADTTRPAAKE